MPKVKTKIVWIPMEEVIPPANWALPFTAEWQGTEYRVTGADFVDRAWRAEKI